MSTPCEILCEWAWTKVNLENLQRSGQSLEIENAIHAYKHALRKKKKLDSEYREHHAALALADDKQV